MLTDRQIEDYRRDGYLVIPRLIEGEQLAELRALTDRIVSEARGVTRQRRALRPRAQPQRHPAPGASPEARDLQALRLLPGAGARAEDRRDPAAAARTVDPPLWRQAQHEIGGLRLAGRMAPGLGLLSAYQRRRPGHRHLSRRLRHGQRPAAGAARHASRPDLRPSRRWPVLRRDEPGRAAISTSPRPCR